MGIIKINFIELLYPMKLIIIILIRVNGPFTLIGIIMIYIWLSRGNLLGPQWILWLGASLRSTLKGLDQAYLNLTLSQQLIRVAVGSMTGCLTSLGLEGIGFN